MNANQLCLSLLPFAADEIKRVEQMYTDGTVKREFALGHVRSVYESTSGPEAFGTSFDDLEEKMGNVIDGLVGMYNEDGTFVRQRYLKQA